MLQVQASDCCNGIPERLTRIPPISETVADTRSLSSALAALAVLATRLGIDTDVEPLRRRFSLGPGEPDTATLIAIAKKWGGLEAQSLHMSFTELPRLAKTLPVILRAAQWGGAHSRGCALRSDEGGGRDNPRSQAPDEEQIAIEEIRLAEVWEGEVILIKRAHLSDR